MRHFGSAFFVNRESHFLTARHVMEDADAFSKAEKFTTALLVKAERGHSPMSQAAFIRAWEPAPEPNDVALGCMLDYQCDHEWRVAEEEITAWREVSTYGYPESAVVGEVGKLQLNIRCLKGYVQRILKPGDVSLRKNSPPGFETSFLLSPGLSGSPLMLCNKDDVIGVCVSSYSSEIVDHSVTEVQADGTKLIEKRLRVEQYGCADDLRPNLDWRPTMLTGRRLRDVLPK